MNLRRDGHSNEIANSWKVLPRCSKFLNSSKLAQPGLSTMASPTIVIEINMKLISSWDCYLHTWFHNISYSTIKSKVHYSLIQASNIWSSTTPLVSNWIHSQLSMQWQGRSWQPKQELLRSKRQTTLCYTPCQAHSILETFSIQTWDCKTVSTECLLNHCSWKSKL